MVPFSTLSERFDFMMRAGLAYCLIAALFLLNIAALPYPFTGLVQIPFILIALYYWSIYRPTFLPGLVVFAAGLMFDIIGGGPLGVNALLFFVMHWLLVDQRGFLLGQSFLMIWLVFGMLNAGVVILRWCLYGALQFNWAPFAESLPAIGLGFVAFPFIAALLHITHRILPGA